MSLNVKFRDNEEDNSDDNSEKSESSDHNAEALKDATQKELEYKELDKTKISEQFSSDSDTENIVNAREKNTEDNVISGNSALIASPKADSSDSEISDFENKCSSPDKCIITSTPQHESLENLFSGYKPLIIPSETKYVELMLLFNKDATTSFAQLAKNEDQIFSQVSIYVYVFIYINKYIYKS